MGKIIILTFDDNEESVYEKILHNIHGIFHCDCSDIPKKVISFHIGALEYDIVWQEPYSGDYNIVMSHVRHIREKIEDDPGKPLYIQTVWGIGYRFNKNLSSSL